MCFPCCWPFADVKFEDVPPPRKQRRRSKNRVATIKRYTYAAPPQQFCHPVPPPQAGYYGYHPGMMPVPMVVPAPAPKPEYKPPKAAKWQGRTKKQVDEDNMKIAAREGACEKRKVQPVGVKDEQMMWCVETDGSTTLRTFLSIKELAGEWKQYPQYEDAWYFLREQEKKED